MGTKDYISYLLNIPQIHSLLSFLSNFVQVLIIFYLDYVITLPLCCLPQHINPLSHSFIDLGNFYKEPNLNTFTQVLDSVERIWEEDRLTKMTIPTSWCCAGVSPGCCGEWSVPNLSWKDVQKGSVHLNDPGETFLKCKPNNGIPLLKN